MHCKFSSTKLTIFVVVMSMSFIGCSNNLSRSKAKEDLAKYSTINPWIMFFTSFGDGLGYDGMEQAISTLQRDGYLSTYTSTYGWKRFRFTQKSNEFRRDESGVVLGKFKTIEITGIAQLDNNSAKVEYRITYACTPFGKAFEHTDSKIVAKEAFFTKYDNGWRINE